MAKKQNKVKICLWTHVQNEAPIIRKMLETAVDYIDYWVLVDNGSTDGTQDIIKDFFKEHNVEGKLYQSEIGWKGHGINRQHSWDFLKATDHGCDYILRIDADEGLEVDDDFDWSVIPSKEAWSIIFTSDGFCVPRMWMWKADLPWYWADDVAHETIHLESGEPDEGTLPISFRHISIGSGNSYQNPIKYIQDVLKLENQLHERFRDGSSVKEEQYHLFYLCKSFNYSNINIFEDWCKKLFPYGEDHIREFLKRGIFYYSKYLETFPEDGTNWYTYYLRSDLYARIGCDVLANQDLEKSYKLRPDRAEALSKLFGYNYRKNNWQKAFEYAKLIHDLKCPVNNDPWNLELNAYYENNWVLRDNVAVAFERMGSLNGDKSLLLKSKEIFENLMKEKNVPEEEKDRIQGNINYLEEKI